MKKHIVTYGYPKTLYKFTRFDTFFDKAELRISPICDLNDPFEGMPIIEHLWPEDEFINDYDNKLKKIANQSSIREYGLERLRIEAKENPKYVYKILKYAISKSNISSMIRNYFINDNIRVLSLTSCNNNELLWSFYADSHKGFVVGLKSDHQIFSANFWDDEKLNVGLRKIRYTQRRRKFYLEVKNNFCIETLLYKSKAWEYEREWRLIISNTKKLHDNSKGKCGFLCIPDDAISEIILGYNAGESLTEEAKLFCKNRNILLQKAVVNKFKYKIDIKKL